MSMEWNIRVRGTRCCVCDTLFADGQVYCSELYTGEAGYERQDFCERCWEEHASSEHRFSSWQGVFRIPPCVEKNEPVRKETAESLLRRLIDSDEQTHPGVLYILAVMLERTKIFVEKDIQRNEHGEKVRIYEHRRTGDVFMITDPELRLDRLDEVQQRVSELLGT